MVLSCADDCALKLWDFKSGKCVRTLGNPHEPESTTPTSQQARCWLQQPAGSEVEASVGTKALGDLPLGRRLKGHKDRVKTCCVFNASADGRTDEHAVLAKPVSAGEGQGHEQWVRGCFVFYACSGDLAKSTTAGYKALSASADKTMKLWNLTTGNCEQTLEGHEDWVMSCSAFRQKGEGGGSGRWIAVSCSSDATVKFWDLSDRDCATTSITDKGYPRKVEQNLMHACCFDFSAGQDASETCQHVFKRPAVLTCGRDYTLKAWLVPPDLAPEQRDKEPQLRLVGHGDWVSSCDVKRSNGRARDGDVLWVLSGSDDRTLKLWKLLDYAKNKDEDRDPSQETTELRCSSTLIGHTREVLGCSLFVEKSVATTKLHALSCAADGNVRLWDLSEDAPFGACLRTIQQSEDCRARGCDVFSGASHFGLCCSADRHVYVWDLTKLLAGGQLQSASQKAEQVGTPNADQRARLVRELTTASEMYGVQERIDAQTEPLLPTPRPGAGVTIPEDERRRDRAIRFAQRHTSCRERVQVATLVGAEAYTTVQNVKEWCRWTQIRKDGQAIFEMQLFEKRDELATDNGKLYTRWTGELRDWCIFHVPLNVTLAGVERTTDGAPETKKRPMALTCGDDQCLQLWDLSRKPDHDVPAKPVCTMMGHSKAVVGCCVSIENDSFKAFSISEDHTLRVWDLRAGLELVCGRQKVPNLQRVVELEPKPELGVEAEAELGAEPELESEEREPPPGYVITLHGPNLSENATQIQTTENIKVALVTGKAGVIGEGVIEKGQFSTTVNCSEEADIATLVLRFDHSSCVSPIQYLEKIEVVPKTRIHEVPARVFTCEPEHFDRIWVMREDYTYGNLCVCVDGELFDCSAASAASVSEPLANIVEDFQDQLQHTLRTGWHMHGEDRGRGWEKLLRATLTLGERMTSAQEANIHSQTTVGKTTLKQKLIEAMEHGRKKSPPDTVNPDAQYAKQVFQVLTCLAECTEKLKSGISESLFDCVTGFEPIKFEYTHAVKVLSWASVALTLSVRMSDETTTQTTGIEAPASASAEASSSESASPSTDSLFECAAQNDSWIAKCCLGILDLDNSSSRREPEKAFEEPKYRRALITRFLNAYKNLHCDDEVSRGTVAHEMLTATNVVRLFESCDGQFPGLVLQFLQELTLRPVRHHLPGSIWYPQLLTGIDNLATVPNKSWVTTANKFWGPSSENSVIRNQSFGWAYSNDQNDQNKGSRPLQHFMVPLRAPGSRHEWAELVRVAVGLSQKRDDLRIFKSEPIRVVVDCLWHSGTRSLYRKLVLAFSIHVVLFAWLASVDDKYVLMMVPCVKGVQSCNPTVAGAVVGWLISLILVICSGFIQFTITKGKHRVNPYSLSDAVGAVFTLITCSALASELLGGVLAIGIFIAAIGLGLTKKSHAVRSMALLLDGVPVLLAAASLVFMLVWRDNSQLHDVDTLQASTLFCMGLKFLQHLRGFKSTAFMMNMLEQILKDMLPFTLVLSSIVLAFTAVFHLLLRDSTVSYVWDEGHKFSTPGSTSVTVANMALGDFDIEYFRQAPYAIPATGLLMLFVFIVPVVMLNALIAIMTDSYEQVKVQKLERKVLQRAQIIVELESNSETNCLSPLQQSFDKTHSYIHVLRVADGLYDRVDEVSLQPKPEQEQEEPE